MNVIARSFPLKSIRVKAAAIPVRLNGSYSRSGWFRFVSLTNALLILTIGFALTLLPCCKEIGPDINLHGNNSFSDTTYIESPVAAPEAKNVVIEEITGVQCPNCPAGHALLSTLKSQYAAGKIVAIALHPLNPLGFPYPFSRENLIDTNSTKLCAYLGYPGSEPDAGIDRQLFPGQTFILIDRNYWSGFTTQEMALAPQVNILLSDIYNPSNRQLTITAELHYTQNVSQPNNITIALTEDSVVTAQLNGTVIDTFYVHNDVLRNIVTQTTGDNVAYNPNITLVAGRVVRLQYQTTLQSSWNADKMKAIAFVHEHATSQVIYQAKQINVIP